MKYKFGFTLAEVLITLVVIGVIAAITVPSLINNIQGQQYRSALKKTISEINQGLAMHYVQTGEGIYNAIESPNFGEYIIDLFQKQMNAKILDDFEFTNCPGGGLMPNGAILCVTGLNALDPEPVLTEYCDTENKYPCGSIFIDVNGYAKPNTMTTSGDSPKDQYMGIVYNTKVVPYGDAAQQVMYDK